MDAQDTFDFEQARRERDAGIKRATDHANRVEPRWADTAYAFLEGYAARHASFTSEDVRIAGAGLIPEPPDKRAFGGVMLRAARGGLIAHHGFAVARDPRVHCNTVRVWRSLIYKGVAA